MRLMASYIPWSCVTAEQTALTAVAKIPAHMSNSNIVPCYDRTELVQAASELQGCMAIHQTDCTVHNVATDRAST